MYTIRSIPLNLGNVQDFKNQCNLAMYSKCVHICITLCIYIDIMSITCCIYAFIYNLSYYSVVRLECLLRCCK